MKLVKQIGYKLIAAICIVTTLCCFVASTPVQASKVNTSDFYYSGTQKGSYSVEKGFLDKLVDSLGMILDYIVGIATMGFRIVLVGWTALLERCLTWLVDAAAGDGTDVSVNGLTATGVTSPDGWITLDAIFFNQVPLLDINVFDFEGITEYDARGHKIEDETAGGTEEHNAPIIIDTNKSEQTETKVVQGEENKFKAAVSQTVANGGGGSSDDTQDDQHESLIIVLKKAVAGWYYTFRVLSIMAMLILLVYIGIQLAIKSSVTDKALYKKVLVDWLVGMILVFSIHYIMLFIIQFNEILVQQISELRLGTTGLEYYEYGLLERAQEPITNEELEITLYDEVKTRAYDAKFTVGFTGMVMYMVLVYYAWKFTFIYLKRYLTVIVLVMVAPFVTVSYAFNKLKGRKAGIFSKWLKEFSFIVILQSIHALMYVVFLSTILAISLRDVSAILLVFMLLNFMCKAEGLFRKIFGITGSLTDDADKGGVKDALDYLKGGFAAIGGAKVAGKITKAGAKLATFPVRRSLGFAGSKAFGAIQAHRANSPKYEDKVKDKEGKKVEKANKLRMGSIAKAIQDGDIDVEKLRESLAQYEKDNAGDIEAIDKERNAFAEIEAISQNMEDHLKEYKKQTSHLAHTKNYISNKWNDIMEPKQYLRRVEKTIEKADGTSETTYKYKTRTTKREYGHFGKKYDSVGKVFASHMNLGMDEKSKAELKVMTEFLKKEITGFVGIASGLPLLVAEPAAGAVFLYKGVQSAHEVFGGQGRRKKRDLKHMKLMPNGKYKLVGFEGGSVKTIANQAQRDAEEQIQAIADSKRKHERKMIANLRIKHPKVYKALAIGGKTLGTVAGVQTGINAVTAAGLAGVTVTGTVAGSLAGVAIGTGILTGAVLNLQGNLYMQVHNVKRMAYKNAAKQSEFKDKSMEAFLDSLANDYNKMEQDNAAAAVDNKVNEFAVMYAALTKASEKEIDEMNDEQLAAGLDFEDVVEVKEEDGKKQISSVAEENKLLDNAIIESAQKSGTIDITKFSIESNKNNIRKDLATKLIMQGVISKDAELDELIEDLDEKLKQRQAIMAAERPKAVEEKMADDSIAEAMRSDKIEDIDKVKTEAVEKIFQSKMQKMQEGLQPTGQASSVIANMQSQKPDDATSITPEQIIEQITENSMTTVMIRDRKNILSKKAKTPISSETAERMKATLKRKKALELDQQILLKEQELKEGKEATPVSDMLSNLNGGANPSEDGSVSVDDSKSDSYSVVDMLNLQTQLYKDKQKLDKVNARTSKEAKLQAYRTSLAEEKSKAKQLDGGKTFDSTQDGSREVTKDGSIKIDTTTVGLDVEQLLSAIKSQTERK